MPLEFQNQYSQTAYVALLWYESSCAGQPWKKYGWYTVDPGKTTRVVKADLTQVADANWAWYAYAADGREWSGTGANWYWISNPAKFAQCYDDNTNCNIHRNFIGWR